MKKPISIALIASVIVFHLVPFVLLGSIFVFMEKVERTDKAVDGAFVDTEWIIGKTAEEIEERFGVSDQIFTGVNEYYVYYQIEYEDGVAVSVSLKP